MVGAHRRRASLLAMKRYLGAIVGMASLSLLLPGCTSSILAWEEADRLVVVRTRTSTEHSRTCISPPRSRLRWSDLKEDDRAKIAAAEHEFQCCVKALSNGERLP